MRTVCVMIDHADMRWIWIGFTKIEGKTYTTGLHWCDTREEAEERAKEWETRPSVSAEELI